MNEVTRSVSFTLERAAVSGDGLTLSGHAAMFNSPTRIRGEIPAEFDETIAPGAFSKTIRENPPVLMYDHGKHPMVGSLPIGQITTLKEDARGLFVEARLHDNWLVAPVRDAIKSGSISGMSFRFSVPKGKETWDRSGDIPLRTLHEVRCMELGPVVFPAYKDTSVAVRSMIDALDDDTAVAVVQAFRDATETERTADTIAEQIEQLLAELDAIEEGTSRRAALSTLFVEQPAPEQPPEALRGTPGERARVLRDLQLQGVLP